MRVARKNEEFKVKIGKEITAGGNRTGRCNIWG